MKGYVGTLKLRDPDGVMRVIDVENPSGKPMKFASFDGFTRLWIGRELAFVCRDENFFSYWTEAQYG